MTHETTTVALRTDPAHLVVRTASRAVDACEIRLGSLPRGSVVLVHDRSAADLGVAGWMNELAMHGYESIAVPVHADLAPDELVRAAASVFLDRGRSPANVGLLGTGAGARAVLGAAAERYGAAISLSPADGLTADEARDWVATAARRIVRTPWLGLVSTAAEASAAAGLDDLGAGLSRSPVAATVVTYLRVGPDFYRNAHESMAHAAAFDAWQRAIEWLNLQVFPPVTAVARSWLGRCEDMDDVSLTQPLTKE